MTYCTEQDLIDRYDETELIQLTDEHGTGAIDSIKVARAIADAQAEIDAHMAGRYSVPLSPVPNLIKRLACEIARYYLYNDGATEQVTKRYDSAIALLKDIANGKASIGIDDAGAAPVSDNSATMVTGGHVMGRGNGGIV